MKFKQSLKVFFVILFICSITRLEAQMPHFYAMDDSLVSFQKFYTTDTVIVISPDSEPISVGEQQEVQDFAFFFKKPVFIFKKESDVVPMDLQKHLHLFGTIFKFKKEYSQIPVKACANGFLYKTEPFTKDNDAFFYLNDNEKVLYSCKNKASTLSPFTAYGVGTFQFLIFRDYEICYSGFFDETTRKEKLNDIRKFKKLYFQQKPTAFFNLNIAKTLNVDSINNFLPDELDKYVVNLCGYLKVDTSHITRMNLYIYADRIELQKINAAPLWNTIYGRCMGNVLHSYSINTGTIKHETSHSIILQKIGNYPVPVLSEGFRQYTDYLFNKEAYNSDLKITKANLGLLNTDFLDVHKFNNHMQNYSISGVFVKYLIDKIGFSEFKTAYSQGKIEEYLNEKYKMSTEQLLAEFKNTL